MNLNLLAQAGRTGSKEEAVKVLVAGGYLPGDALETAAQMFPDAQQETSEHRDEALVGK